ncbi:MAG: carboxymuconolactone decarboxylase family protein [Rhodospirillaceae bacterium]|nr:carboxymuconolactone decarboxylase family protein [Rhodospirillaceae bacterium]MCY4066181.1 carboxymuconolactone decarboxylase family protein [Rhodospirillaceae bacterium]
MTELYSKAAATNRERIAKLERLTGLPDTLDARQQALHDRIASGPRGRVAGPLALWLHSPELCERAQALGEHLRFNNVLPKALSEMTILIVSAHHRCDYEWHVHAQIAEREGLPADTIAAVKAGRKPDGLPEDADALYDFATGLLRDNAVSDAAYRGVAEHFGTAGVVELAALIGYYQIGAHTLNAVDFRIPGAPSPFGRYDGTG